MRPKVSSGKSKPCAHPTQNPCQILQRSEFQFLDKMQTCPRQNTESMKRSTSLSILHKDTHRRWLFNYYISLLQYIHTDMLLNSYETHNYELNPQTYRTYMTIISFTLIKSSGLRPWKTPHLQAWSSHRACSLSLRLLFLQRLHGSLVYHHSVLWLHPAQSLIKTFHVTCLHSPTADN